MSDSTAVRCFLEVSERYPGHAFAHDYLAKCYSKMDPVKYKNEIEKNEKIKKHILSEDDDGFWTRAYEYFKNNKKGYLENYELRKKDLETKPNIII